MEQYIPRILIAGTNSGCGKTTTVCALLQAITNRGLKAASFKCGPDYIDPMFHSRIIGTPSRNLDLFMLPENTVRYLLAENSRSADISVMEGVMGFYDGVGMSSQASSYDLARKTDTPVILVVNARGAARSLLAVIRGYAELEPDSNVRGVIFNSCSPMLYPQLKQLVQDHFGGRIRPLGYFPSLPQCSLESRHLGLITAAEVEDLKQKMQILAQQAEKSLDIDAILELARSAQPLQWQEPELPQPGSPVKIAVARDKAFCFYYEDSLHLLEKLGAQLIPFSPMFDSALPDGAQGVYLGGGYPELYKEALSGNMAMRCAIHSFLERGGACIAECGGFLYLHEKLDGFPMVGYLPGNGENRNKLVRFGYVTLTAQQDNLLCAKGERFAAHEFHYYDVDNPGSCFTAEKSTGRRWPCGVASERLYAGFPHFHFYTSPGIAERFLNACRKDVSND